MSRRGLRRNVGAMSMAMNQNRLLAKARILRLLSGNDQFVMKDGATKVQVTDGMTRAEHNAQAGRQGSKGAKKRKGKG